MFTRASSPRPTTGTYVGEAHSLYWPWPTKTLLQAAPIFARLACRQANTRMVSSLADLQNSRLRARRRRAPAAFLAVATEPVRATHPQREPQLRGIFATSLRLPEPV